MSQKPKKWPDYALGSLEGTLLHLKTIDGLARQVQEAAKQGDAIQASILSGDIRGKTIDAIALLHQARTGDYEP